jgi:hypothetical protein
MQIMILAGTLLCSNGNTIHTEKLKYSSRIDCKAMLMLVLFGAFRALWAEHLKIRIMSRPPPNNAMTDTPCT